MKDLFGNDMNASKIYRRDSFGRFADERTAKYERAVKEAGMYKQMYLAAQSRMRGLAKILRMKDELIFKLKNNG
jgi:hypothetical protein